VPNLRLLLIEAGKFFGDHQAQMYSMDGGFGLGVFQRMYKNETTSRLLDRWTFSVQLPSN
jgi:hypothetical protein